MSKDLFHMSSLLESNAVFRAISRMRMVLKSTLMMEAETVSETWDYNAIAREDFIAFSCRESFKSYIAF
jgi:hypothetical protein